MAEFVIDKVLPDRRASCVGLLGKSVSGLPNLAGKKLIFEGGRKYTVGYVSNGAVIVEDGENLSIIGLKYETPEELNEISDYFLPGKRILLELE